MNQWDLAMAGIIWEHLKTDRIVSEAIPEHKNSLMTSDNACWVADRLEMRNKWKFMFVLPLLYYINVHFKISKIGMYVVFLGLIAVFFTLLIHTIMIYLSTDIAPIFWFYLSNPQDIQKIKELIFHNFSISEAPWLHISLWV